MNSQTKCLKDGHAVCSREAMGSACMEWPNSVWNDFERDQHYLAERSVRQRLPSLNRMPLWNILWVCMRWIKVPMRCHIVLLRNIRSNLRLLLWRGRSLWYHPRRLIGARRIVLESPNGTESQKTVSCPDASASSFCTTTSTSTSVVTSSVSWYQPTVFFCATIFRFVPIEEP